MAKIVLISKKRQNVSSHLTPKVNHLTNGTPQRSSILPTLFNMVINQLLQLNLGSKVQMIVYYVDELVIHGDPIGGAILYKQMTTSLKKIETRPQLSSSRTNVRPYGAKQRPRPEFQDRWRRDPMTSIS